MLLRLISHQQSAGIAAAAMASFLLATPLLAQAPNDSSNATTSRGAYSQKIAATYKDHFVAGHPFLPSNMTTDTGQFINPKSFLSAEYCAHCHQEAHAEWRQSAHANSFRTPWYVFNVNTLNDKRVSAIRVTAKAATIPPRLLPARSSMAARARAPTTRTASPAWCAIPFSP